LATSKPEQLRGGARKQCGGADGRAQGKNERLPDVAILNAAAAILVSGKAKDLKEGVAIATKSVDSAEAEGRLVVSLRYRMPDILTKIEAYKRERSRPQSSRAARRGRGCGQSRFRRAGFWPRCSAAQKGDFALITE